MFYLSKTLVFDVKMLILTTHRSFKAALEIIESEGLKCTLIIIDYYLSEDHSTTLQIKMKTSLKLTFNISTRVKNFPMFSLKKPLTCIGNYEYS